MDILLSFVFWLAILLLAIALLVAHRLDLHRRDKRRISRHITDAGGRVLDLRWTPFGRGWLVKGNRRLYRVRYVDAGGQEHRAYGSTAWLGGVYFSDDIVTKTEVIRVRDDRCPKCGYSLIGNVSEICPECGMPVPGAARKQDQV